MGRNIVVALAAASLAVVAGARLSAQQNEKLPEAAQQARTAAEAHVKGLGYQGPLRLTWVDDAAVKKAFGDTQFIAVLFPQYPLGREPPQGLKVANVFAFEGAKLRKLTDAKELEAYFKDRLRAAQADGDAVNAAKAFARLGQELFTDGFYQFGEPTAKAAKQGGTLVATARVEVKPQGGNKGHIDAQLRFGGDGKLVAAEATAKLVEGIRPICQALRLLDADSVVRRMAERDILVMGQMARDYLMEQRATAGPELRQAIDRLWQRILDEGR